MAKKKNMEKTYEELVEVLSCKAEVEEAHGKESKFYYAMSRVADRITSATKKINKETSRKMRDIAVELASVDKQGNLIVEKESYKFTVENQKKYDEQLDDLMDKRDAMKFDIEPYIMKDYPVLTARQERVFEGLLIPTKINSNE